MSSNAACANSVESGEETEVLRFSFSLTFSQHLDKSKLPVTLQRTLEYQESAEEQDKTLLSALDLLAIADPMIISW
jgi:hypothetical protein